MNEIMMFGRRIPGYYDTMYLDGYTPYEILEATSNKIYSNHQDRKEEAESFIVPTINFKTTVKIK